MKKLAFKIIRANQRFPIQFLFRNYTYASYVVVRNLTQMKDSKSMKRIVGKQQLLNVDIAMVNLILVFHLKIMKKLALKMVKAYQKSTVDLVI